MALTARTIRTAKVGTHYDGRDGLALSVMKGARGTRRYFVQYLRVDGKRTSISIGRADDWTLAEAREMAQDNARALRRGEPLRHGGRKVRAASVRPVPTFAEGLEAWIALQRGAWKKGARNEDNIRAAARHGSTLDSMSVADIGTDDVIGVLRQIWIQKVPTANMLRRTISAVMEWARSEGHRRDNPADARIDHALPKRVRKVAHRAALPYGRMPEILRAVAALETPRNRAPVLALQFLALTGARGAEVRGMRWNEVDVDAALWTLPASRAKTGREHRFPLCAAAMDILSRAKAMSGDRGMVFAARTGKIFGDTALRDVLTKAGFARSEVTPHGFRTMLREYIDTEHKTVEWTVRELCVAHDTRSKTESAYSRGDMLDARRPLIDAWGALVAPR